MSLIEKIFEQADFRIVTETNDAWPDWSNKNHIKILSEVLFDNNVQLNKINEIISNLTEADDDDKYVSKGYGYFVRKGDEDKEDAQKYKKDDNGKYVAVSPKQYDKDKQKQGDAGEKAAAKTSQNQQGGGEEDSTAEEPQTGGAFKGKVGDDYRDNLPDNDPASTKQNKSVSKSAKFFDDTKITPEIGKVSDIDDEFSDGNIKQKALEIGFKEVDGFKPAPGNAGSMLGEIMSGEAFSHIDENPNIDEDELFEKLHEQVKDTELGKQNGSDKRTKTGLLDATYRKNLRAIAKAGLTKHRENQSGIQTLSDEGKMDKDVKVRNFYGHETSISQQVKLVESINGPIYTKEGIEVPKEVVVDLIKKSGGGENPSDTSTISVDKNGRAMVTFHSDKLSTADIQANSTPNKESEQAKQLVENIDLPDYTKQDIINTIESGQLKLEEKENQLKSAANEPSNEMANGDISQILKDIKSDKGVDSKAKVSSHLAKSLLSRGKPHPSIRKYLAETDGTYSEEELLKGFYEYMGDDNKDSEPTASQLKLLYRSAKQNGYDISSTLGRIRNESLEVQRSNHAKLNETNMTLPNGKQVPMGDYIEGKNLIDKLHLNVIDGEKNKSGVGKYPGLFNLNMGGTLVEGDQLKNCMNVNGTTDFIDSFEVGKPGDGEEVTTNRETGQVTGRNIFIFAITKDNKRIPVAFKTQRSKQGESGKLSTTYQWTKEMQSCFKK